MIKIYTVIEHNELEYVGYIDRENIHTWLETDGKYFLNLRLVEENGSYADIALTESIKWDVINRGMDTSLLSERKHTFKDYNKTKTTKLERNVKKADKDKPLDQRSHMMKAARGLDRKNQSYVPMYKQLAHKDALPTAENVLKNAKSASSGAWKLSNRQVMEIAGKYKFNVPNAKKRTKHLGSTGILMWRKNAKSYYLVKFNKHHHKKGR